MVMVVVMIIDKEDNDDDDDYDASWMGPQGAPGCSLLYRDQTCIMEMVILLRSGLWFWCFFSVAHAHADTYSIFLDF